MLKRKVSAAAKHCQETEIPDHLHLLGRDRPVGKKMCDATGKHRREMLPIKPLTLGSCRELVKGKIDAKSKKKKNQKKYFICNFSSLTQERRSCEYWIDQGHCLARLQLICASKTLFWMSFQRWYSWKKVVEEKRTCRGICKWDRTEETDVFCIC